MNIIVVHSGIPQLQKEPLVVDVHVQGGSNEDGQKPGELLSMSILVTMEEVDVFLQGS